MPKIVDHEQRRREVAQAVLRVVARQGVVGVTLNAIAAESGWSRGVLTHYFDNKSSLLEAALRQGMREISANLRAAAGQAEARRALRLVLEAALPLDERRLAFSRVYVSFMAEAMVSEHLQAYFTYNHGAWRDLIAAIVERGCDQGEIGGKVDAHWVADALGAMAEGLRMRALFDSRLSADRQRAQLAGWIDTFLPVPDEGRNEACRV
jgi:AcrR family transcriptional regulator